MIDFTSASYLGLRHPAGSLWPWDRLTTGVPAALADPPGAADVAASLAALQGCGDTVLAPSTLHLFWDLFDAFADPGPAADRPGTTVHYDAGLYTIGRWGVERAGCRGLPVRAFAHHDPASLERHLAEDRKWAGDRWTGNRPPVPIVVADGFCPACGRAAPLAAYLRAARRAGGWLVLDDTQALGVLGAGGGGSLRHAALAPAERDDVLLVSSLAKAFGAPLAALSGSAERVSRFRATSRTRVHCSPPSAADLAAAAAALAVNRRCGDALRLRLTQLVRRFRARLAGHGVRPAGGEFPVQSVIPPASVYAARVHAGLLRCGVQTALVAADERRPGLAHDGRAAPGGRAPSGPVLCFVFTARHRADEVDYAADALVRQLRADRCRDWAISR